MTSFLTRLLFILRVVSTVIICVLYFLVVVAPVTLLIGPLVWLCIGNSKLFSIEFRNEPPFTWLDKTLDPP